MKKIRRLTIFTLLLELIIPFYMYSVQAVTIPSKYDLRSKYTINVKN